VLTKRQTPSWQWYYPYHFAPFAADFLDVEHMDIKFNLGQPFKPFEQLMSVFPAARFALLYAFVPYLSTDIHTVENRFPQCSMTL
jgi:5'-3' exoribonuclease 2